MKNKLILISGDDWEGLYLNDEIYIEGHSIRKRELVEAMRLYETFDVTFISLNDDGLEWLHENASLPVAFAEIPEQFIC